MVIQRPFNSVFERMEQARRGRRLSTGAWVAIVLSALLHLGGLAWLYSQHFRPAPIDAVDEGPVTTVTPVELPPKPAPAQRLPPPPPVPIHRPTTPLSEPPVVAPLPSQPPQPLATDARPEVLSQAPILPDPTPPLTQAAPPVASPPAPAVIRDPNWLKRPTAGQLSQYYPATALERGVSGEARLTCLVLANGALTACTLLSETPASMGFAAAAFKLTRYFQMSPRTEDGAPVEGGRVTIPIRFSAE